MKKTNELTYERAIEILRYDAETGVLERKINNGEWRVCGNRPIHSAGYVDMWAWMGRCISRIDWCGY